MSFKPLEVQVPITELPTLAEKKSKQMDLNGTPEPMSLPISDLSNTLDKNNNKNISPQRHKIRNLWNLEVIPRGLICFSVMIIMVVVYDLKNQQSEKIKLMNAKFFG